MIGVLTHQNRPPMASADNGYEYYVPIEHHNPMELFASTVIFEGDGKLANL